MNKHAPHFLMGRFLIGISLIACACPATAQEEDASALEELDRQKAAQVAATVEVQGAAELRGAMLRIARSPTDSDALTDAGNAALMLGDANAALNFFTRANALQPSNGRIKLGLAVATVRTENPFEALRLFDEAIKLGIPERAVAGDRALAFDLLGNFGRAQQDYNIARQSDRSSRLVVQQAISIALLGKEGEADAMLYPLLQQNYGEAWRARAFLLAARGDYKESVKVTQGFMDARSAQQFERYLRQMPQLTGAQKAAAIHLGHFPAINIGRDSDSVQRVAANYPNSGSGGSGRLIPAGDPLGPKAAQTKNVAKLSRRERERAAKRAAQEVQVPAAIARPVSDVADLGSRIPLPIDIARIRIFEVEKASFTLVAATLPVVLVSETPPPRPQITPAMQQVAVVPPVSAPQNLPDSVPEVVKPVAILTPPVQVPAPIPATTAAPAMPPDTMPVPTPTPEPAQPVQSVTTPPVTVTQTPVILPSAPEPVNVTPEPVQNASIVETSQVTNNLPATESAVSILGVIPAVTEPTVQTSPENIPTGSDSVPAVRNIQDGSSSPVAESPPVQAPLVQAEPIIGGTAQSEPAQTEPASKPALQPAPPFDLGAIVNAIDIPEDEKRRDVIPVDLKKLPVATLKAKEAVMAEDKKSKTTAKQPEQNNTPRIWVQVATGDAGGFSADLRIFRRKYAELFKGKDSWSSPWGRQSRLLVGPFDDMKVAKKWEADFRKAGGDGFVWRSEKGVEVKALKAK